MDNMSSRLELVALGVISLMGMGAALLNPPDWETPRTHAPIELNGATGACIDAGCVEKEEP